MVVSASYNLRNVATELRSRHPAGAGARHRSAELVCCRTWPWPCTYIGRLAAIDPPVLRSLIVELTRISPESAAGAAQAGTAEAAALANRNAQRAAAARAALASAEATA